MASRAHTANARALWRGWRRRASGPVTFEVGKGEIVGLTGLIGSGFDRVCAALYGAERAAAGRLIVAEETAFELAAMDPPQALAAGVVYLPADRLRAGGVGALPVADNVLLPVLSQMRNRLGLDKARMAEDGAGARPDLQRQAQRAQSAARARCQAATSRRR